MGDVRDTVALRFHAACLSHMDPAAFEPIVEGRWLEGFNWKSIIPDVRCPILLLQADTAAGGMLTNDDAHFLIDHATDLTAVRFPDISHQIHGTDTAAFLKFVIPFLESVRICMIS
jgi:pimeloyl-ACP methyl ester carboxylesterase